jgi:hypothetical protein
MGLFAVWSAISLYCPPGGAQAQAPSTMTEYQLKAVFLFNFAKYVDWPPETFPTTNAPITIGVVGQDQFKDDLNHIVEGKSVNGRAIVIKHVTTDAEIGSCQILFISASENSRLDEILSKTSALPILTVGENEQFWQKGGIINFALKEKKVRLEINLHSAQQAKVQISSQLLKVADMVKGKSS